eukprot:2470633-Prymnesium_polylepis.1
MCLRVAGAPQEARCGGQPALLRSDDGGRQPRPQVDGAGALRHPPHRVRQLVYALCSIEMTTSSSSGLTFSPVSGTF